MVFGDERVTFAEFNRKFHELASSETLRGIGRQILSAHLRRLKESR